MNCKKLDENSNELSKLFRECFSTIQSNIVFQFPDGEKKETYFDEDTPIEVIKAYISSESYSIKDIKMSILKKAAESKLPSKESYDKSLPPLDSKKSKKTANEEKVSKKPTNEEKKIKKSANEEKSSNKPIGKLPPLHKNSPCTETYNSFGGRYKDKNRHTQTDQFAQTIKTHNSSRSRIKLTLPETAETAKTTETADSSIWEIELKTIKTFRDLIESNYRYENGDIIRVDYDKAETIPKVAYPSHQPISESVTFVPFHITKSETLSLASEKVPAKYLVSDSKSMVKLSDLRRKLKPVLDKNGNLQTPVTKGLTATKPAAPKKASKYSYYMPTVEAVVAPESKSSDEGCALQTILFSEHGKILHDAVDGESCRLDFSTRKVFVFYVEPDLVDIEEQLLTIEPECAKLFEKPKVSVNSLKIIDYYEKTFVTEIEFDDDEFENASVKIVLEKVAKNVKKDVNDFSLLVEFDGEDILLFDKEELISSVLTKTNQNELMLLEITNKKSAPLRMIKNLKELAGDRLSDKDVNDIFVYSGRSSLISISTVRFYS